MALVTLAMFLAAIPARAQIRVSPEATAVAGGYQLANESGSRTCILLLRTILVPGGMAAGFPAHCKAALPVLGSVAAWTVEPQTSGLRARIRLIGAHNDVLLDFSADGPNNAVVARNASDEAYTLTPRDGRSLATRIDGAAPRRNAAPAGPSLKQTVSDTPRMASLAGTYRTDRGKRSFHGCRLTLAAPAGVGEGRARLEANCQDKGVVFFGPERWTLSVGTLWLLNAKGQKISFERTRSGDWEKGPGQGEPLTLTRAEP